MRRHTPRIVTLADLASLTVAILVASTIALESILPWDSDIAVGSTIPMLVALYAGALLGEVLARQLWRISIRRPSYVRAVLVLATAMGVVAIGALLTRFYWSRPFLLITALVWFSLMVIYRAVWRSRPWQERYVAVTANKDLADDLSTAEHADVIAVVAPDADEVSVATDADMTVLVGDGELVSATVSRFISETRRSGIEVRSFDEAYEEHTGKVSIAHRPDGWEAPMSMHPKAGYGPIKRVLDIVGSLLLAPIALIVTGVAAIWVRADSSGPALFHQERIGRDGRIVTIHKIRTMDHTDTPGAVRTAAEDDARITRAGRTLRRWRIDELPQLWNVVKGDLSIVGPRPEQVDLAAEYEHQIPFYGERHLVRPGITGWAQVHHGYAADVNETVEKLGYDLFYVKHMSVWLDLRVLGRSVWTVVTGFGAR